MSPVSLNLRMLMSQEGHTAPPSCPAIPAFLKFPSLFLPDARECILCTGDDWSNSAHDACVPKIIEFLAFGEPLGITLIVISVFGALVAFAVGVRNVQQQRQMTPLLDVKELKCQMLSLTFPGCLHHAHQHASGQSQ